MRKQKKRTRSQSNAQSPLDYLGTKHRQQAARQNSIDSIFRAMRRGLKTFGAGGEPELLLAVESMLMFPVRQRRG
jgi:hypothetical protein